MMMGNLLQIPPVRLLASERAVFRGRPRYSTLEWAQKHMRIVHGPCKGQKWDAELTPYAKGVFEIFDRENVRKLFLIASSQVAKTTMALICLFAEQCRRQENMGFGYPDQLAARKIMTGIVHPYYKAIAPLRGMLSGDDALQNYETVHRDGSRIYAMWAGSDSSTRSISMARVLIDEEDSAADKSAVLAMQERVTAYAGMGLSKIIRCCRPKGTEKESTIWSDARKEAQAWMRFEVRCPLCGHAQVMEDENIVSVTPLASHKEVLSRGLGRYRCPECGGLWNDMQRDIALRAGNWKVVEGSLEGAAAVAFHLRLWESPLVTLSSVLAEKMQAQGDPRLMQLYENNVRARPYRFVTAESSEEKLVKYIDHDMPQGTIPEWAVCLTLSVDMQSTYFRFSVAAHAVEPERLHIIDYGRLQEWTDLTQFVFTARYVKASGETFGIWRAALDTGGGAGSKSDDSRPMQAQKWLSAQRPGVIWGTKGMSRVQPGVFVRVSDPDRAGAISGTRSPKSATAALRTTPLYLIDTSSFKKLIFWRLSKDGDESEPITFHAQTSVDYLKEIASEKLIQNKNGSEEWVRTRANHYLDCLVGHVAMAHWQWQPSLSLLARRPERTQPQPMRQAEENPFTGGATLFGD